MVVNITIDLASQARPRQERSPPEVGLRRGVEGLGRSGIPAAMACAPSGVGAGEGTRQGPPPKSRC